MKSEHRHAARLAAENRKTPWDGRAPADDDIARDRLLDAAASCFERFGVLKTTVDDVATTAHVSRTTVYRYFRGGRDELILGVFMREVQELSGEIAAAMREESTFPEAVISSIVFAVRSVRDGIHLRFLFSPETVGETANIVMTSPAFYALTSETLRPFFEDGQHRGEIRTDLKLEDTSEWLVRITLSLMTVNAPVERDDDQLRAFLREFLVPMFRSEPSVITLDGPDAQFASRG
ncbi:MAG: TetR/AcrR family transcriptional regulator [Actinomycetota bacterium]